MVCSVKERPNKVRQQKPTTSISRIDAYFGIAILLSKRIAPGNSLTLKLATPQPSKPATAATARTPGPVHVDAVREAETFCGVFWEATFRRKADAVKDRLLPAALTGGVEAEAVDRPNGLTAFAKLLADMRTTTEKLPSVNARPIMQG